MGIKQGKGLNFQSRLEWWWCLCWCCSHETYVQEENWFLARSLETVLGPWLGGQSDGEGGEVKQDYLSTGGSGCEIALVLQCCMNDEWDL